MPPANSRYPSVPDERQQQQQQDSSHPQSYISQALSEALESPETQAVYNLAATLTTQQDEDAHFDTALRSLRANLDEHTAALTQIGVHLGQHDATLDRQQARFERSRDRLRTLERERERSELEHRNPADRLRRVMNRLGRLGDETRGPYRSSSSSSDHVPPQDRLATLHNEARSSAYSDRVPSRNSLYDWSPATDEADDEAELEGILAELRREQPNTHPEILRVLGRSQLDSERERSRAAVSRLLSSTQPSQADSSLRSAALLQSVRRNPRFSARTRDFTQRYADRDAASRSPRPSDWRDRPHMTSESSRAAQRLENARAALEPSSQRAENSRAGVESSSQRSASTRAHDMLQRVDSYRRGYLDRTATAPSSSVSPMLEETIKYLSKIRQSQNIDDSIDYAIDAGFLKKEYFVKDHQNFVLNPFTIPPPAETSWLAPGAVLSGCQHATTITSTLTATGSGTNTTLYRLAHGRSAIAAAAEAGSLLADTPNMWDDPSHVSPGDRAAHTYGPEVVTSHSPQQDKWPVKVTIHSVDYDRMTLSATMEAYNVPSHPHTHQSILSNSTNDATHAFTRTSSITTYLEGEILDFNKHSLLTESFNSTPANDATYWRKLPVFHGMSDDEVIRCLTSRIWFDDVLSKKWVLMRWKERCFVKSLNSTTASPVQPPQYISSRPEYQYASGANWDSSMRSGGGADAEHSAFDDSGCGLTISGFYYVCLRRRDGRVQGLYYDPQSSPYQCLELKSVMGGVFPAWGFR